MRVHNSKSTRLIELSFEIFQFLTNTGIVTKHEQNLRGVEYQIARFCVILTTSQSLLAENRQSLQCTLSNKFIIDNHAKDGGPGGSDFYVIFTMSLCAL